MKLKHIADSLNLETIGNADKEISGLASLGNAGPNDLAFLFSRSYRESLTCSAAGAFVLKKEDKVLHLFGHRQFYLKKDQFYPSPYFQGWIDWTKLNKVDDYYNLLKKNPIVYLGDVVSTQCQLVPKVRLSTAVGICNPITFQPTSS